MSVAINIGDIIEISLIKKLIITVFANIAENPLFLMAIREESIVQEAAI